MSAVRWIRWSCGHRTYQRLTTQNPNGATVIPENCPTCGRRGYTITDEEPTR